MVSDVNRLTSNGVPFGPQGEEAWQQLRQHAEWAEQFWLVFVFAPSGVGPKELEERMETLLQKNQTNQVVLRPDTPDKLRELLPELLSAPVVKAPCVWIEAVRRDISARRIDEDAWAKAWDWFLLRANERREVLRGSLGGGLILAAPTELKARFREAAPDLWSIRSLVLELDDPIVSDSREARSIEDPSFKIEAAESSPDPEMALREARRLAKKRPDALLPQAQALIRASRGWLARGALAEASQAADEAMALLLQMESEPETSQSRSSEINLALALGDLGQILIRLQRSDEAEGWLKKAMYIGEALGDRPSLAIGYANMSWIEQARGRLDEAEGWLRKAIDIDEDLGDRPKLAIRYNNMSQIEKDRGRLDEAEAWLKKAIVIDEDLGDWPNLAIDYNNMSQIEQARGRLDEAEAWLKKAIVIAEDLGDRPNLAIDYNNMSQLEQARGNPDGAEAWQEKAWLMVADLSPSANRQTIGTRYADLLLAKGKEDATRAVRERL